MFVTPGVRMLLYERNTQSIGVHVSCICDINLMFLIVLVIMIHSVFKVLDVICHERDNVIVISLKLSFSLRHNLELLLSYFSNHALLLYLFT